MIWGSSGKHRKKVVSRMIIHIDSGVAVTVRSLGKSFTLLDAIAMLKSAWEDVN